MQNELEVAVAQSAEGLSRIRSHYGGVAAALRILVSATVITRDQAVELLLQRYSLTGGAAADILDHY